MAVRKAREGRRERNRGGEELRKERKGRQEKKKGKVWRGDWEGKGGKEQRGGEREGGEEEENQPLKCSLSPPVTHTTLSLSGPWKMATAMSP